MIPLDDIDTIHNRHTLNNIAQRAETYKPKLRTTYKMINEYIDEKYSFKVHSAYIDAFIRCKIFKNPEGYDYVVTR